MPYWTQMLSASNLGKRYGARWLFRNLEFELGKGDCLVAIGANGSGKSTFLKTLVGLVEPSEGTVAQSGTIAYSALDLALYPALTAAEHLELSGELRNIPSRIEELLDRVGLTRSRDQQSHEYSTGMRARLKIAIALQSNPDVIILDEPGAGLDHVGRELIQSIVDEQTQVGAVIIATNEPAERRFATMELEIGK